jgi:hypothetical protein
MDPWTWVLLCGCAGLFFAMLIAVLLLDGKEDDE